MRAGIVVKLLGELRVRRQLERTHAIGASWCASRIRCTDRRLTPAAFASFRPVRWVSSPVAVRAPGRQPSAWCRSTAVVCRAFLSRVSPSTPSAMNRACHLDTTGFDLPDRRIISAVPQPSAVARMMLTRQMCFCGALRSNTIASSQRRSARVTFTTIPALMSTARKSAIASTAYSGCDCQHK